MSAGIYLPTAETAVAKTRPKSAITVNVNGIPMKANTYGDKLLWIFVFSFRLNPLHITYQTKYSSTRRYRNNIAIAFTDLCCSFVRLVAVRKVQEKEQQKNKKNKQKGRMIIRVVNVIGGRITNQNRNYSTQ